MNLFSDSDKHHAGPEQQRLPRGRTLVKINLILQMHHCVSVRWCFKKANEVFPHILLEALNTVIYYLSALQGRSWRLMQKTIMELWNSFLSLKIKKNHPALFPPEQLPCASSIWYFNLWNAEECFINLMSFRATGCVFCNWSRNVLLFTILSFCLKSGGIKAWTRLVRRWLL